VLRQRIKVSGHIAGQLRGAMHTPEPSSGEDPHPSSGGYRNRRRYGRRSEFPGLCDRNCDIALGRLAGRAKNPTVFTSFQSESHFTVKHRSYCRNRSPTPDRIETTIERFGVCWRRQAEVRKDR
jgi:hypothetical protein